MNLRRVLRFLPIEVILLIAFQSASSAGMPDHPFLLVDRNELAALRAELAKPGWKSEMYRKPGVINTGMQAAGLLSSADAWLKRDIIIPGYGGHGHHFFCDDGTRLVATPDYPFHPGPYRCPNCGKEYDAERYRAAFRCDIHHDIADAALNLALVYAIEQKPEYAAKCAEILLKYAEVYPGPHTGHTKGGILYQSLNEAMWAIPLAQSYDLIYDSLKPEERVKIETFLRTVASGLQKSGTGGNWASWHLSAVGVIGYATHDQELVTWALKLFRKQIRHELGDDGIWPESIQTYHFFVVQAFVNLAEAARHTGVDLYRWEGKPGKSFLSMFSAPLNYAYPDSRLPAVNDGWFNSYLPADVYEIAYRETKDPRYARVIMRKDGGSAGVESTAKSRGYRTGKYAFLYGRDLPSDIPYLRSSSAVFPSVGIGMLRTPYDSAVLTFHYGQFVGHGHPSRMSITLWANGKLWSADYGTPGYGSRILGWYKSTFAHNTVVVDNKGQAPTKEREFSFWPDDGLSEAMESQTSQAYPGVSYKRTVCRVGDYFIIRDCLESDESRTYDFYLHADGRLTLDGREERQGDFEPASSWITEAKIWNEGDMLTGRWEWASQSLDFCVIGSNSVTPITARCPAETGNRTIPLLIARQTGKSAEFVTVLYPHRNRQGMQVEYKSGVLTVVRDGVKDTVVFEDDGKRPVVSRPDL